MRFAALLLLILSTALPAQPDQLDVYVSTGDNHFLGSSLPIDSPASIEATFDLFKNVNHARRAYWRGLEEACWVSTMHARPENPRYHSLWTWMQWLYENVKPDELAVKAAHARGMEIWGVGSLWDWGSPADTPTFGDYPFPFESKLKLEHPEWAAVDKHGARKQGGPIELAYSEARKALVDLTVKETLKAGYDGITFLTYVENYSQRFQDEFGYSAPIIEDFKKLHRVDLRTEGFKRGASREDWLRLRGTYITAYLRELRDALKPHGKKLGMIINGNDLHAPLAWNVPELMKTAGSHHMDVETWVREGLVDNLTVYGNCARNAQMKTLEDLLFLCRNTGVEVNFMTSNPFDDGWQSFHERKVPAVLSMSDDVQHLARGFVPEQSVEALKSDDLSKRMKTLSQIVEGKLSPGTDDLSRLSKSKNIIERRLALQALGKTRSADALPSIEPALNDEENGVRCVAALAIGDLQSPQALPALLKSIEQHGNHMLVECVIIALRKMKPFPASELAEIVKSHKNPTVRMVAMRALLPFASLEQMPAIRAAMLDKDRFTAYAATEAMANIRKTNGNVLPLIYHLSHEDDALRARAAVSLGVLAARNDKELLTQRPLMLSALRAAFEQVTGHEWLFRPIGNAIRAFGDEGEMALRQLRDQRLDMKLAENAWRVLDLHQQPNSFSEVTEKENEAAYAKRPQPGNKADVPPVSSTQATAQKGARAPVSLHVDPNAGNDTNDGTAKPFKTIARAIKAALPGDTIHLAPVIFHESADFTNKHGEIGKPVILDGHGATLEGSEPVTSKDWETLGNGLFRKVKLMPRMDDAMVQRWFFLWNGRMNHMGRTSKGVSAPLKKPADLQPDEWTYVKAEDAFYLRLPADQSLDAANIRYPARSSGVVLSIASSHILVRNVTATHVYNDGYNIHGLVHDSRFENISAIQCGDDGFSAHEGAECEIDGFTSIGNSTGLCDTVTSRTHYKNVFIKDCLGYDVFFVSHGDHSIENAIVESSALRALSIGRDNNNREGICNVRLKNMLVRRVGGGPQEFRVSGGGHLMAEHCTLENLNVQITPDSEVAFKRCIVSGDPKPEMLIWKEVKWSGEGNVYDLHSLRIDKTSFTARTFTEFQKLINSESGSRWSPDRLDSGADEKALRASLQGRIPQ